MCIHGIEHLYPSSAPRCVIEMLGVDEPFVVFDTFNLFEFYEFLGSYAEFSFKI